MKHQTYRIDAVIEETKHELTQVDLHIFKFAAYLLFHVFVQALKSALVRKYLVVIRRTPVRHFATDVVAVVFLFVLVKLMPRSVR